MNDSAMQRYRAEYRRCCGVLVRQLRKEKGWSFDDFSKKAGTSVAWLQRFEENRLTTNYSIRLHMQMIQALGFGIMEMYQFYKRVNEMAEGSVGPPPGSQPTRYLSRNGIIVMAGERHSSIQRMCHVFKKCTEIDESPAQFLHS